MKLRELKELIAEAEKNCTGDADDCEISVVSVLGNEYDIDAVEDEEGERILIFVDELGDETDDED